MDKMSTGVLRYVNPVFPVQPALILVPDEYITLRKKISLADENLQEELLRKQHKEITFDQTQYEDIKYRFKFSI